MKSEYPHYRKHHCLDKNLTPRDRQILEKYLRIIAMTSGRQRVEKYRRYMLHFRDIIEKPLDTITEDDAIAFWGLANNGPYRTSTIIDIQAIVKRFLRECCDDPRWLRKLKLRSKFIVNEERINKAALLTPAELKLMLHRAEKIRDKALVMTLYETAARPQEVRMLKWQSILWDDEQIFLWSGKTRKGRPAPVKQAIQHLKRWKEEWVLPNPQPNDYVFPATIEGQINRDKPISVTYICRLIKSLARKAGIQKDVWTYLFRHTRLTELDLKGIRGKAHNLFAGHVPGSRMNDVYVHLNEDDMIKEVRDKIYEIQELAPTERVNYEHRIAKLETQLHEVVTFLKESRGVMSSVKEQLEEAG